jgi:hypothetical protein
MQLVGILHQSGIDLASYWLLNVMIEHIQVLFQTTLSGRENIDFVHQHLFLPPEQCNIRLL